MVDFWQKRSVGRNLAGLAILGASWLVGANVLWFLLSSLGLPNTYAKQVTWVALAVVTIAVTRWFDRMPMAFVGLDGRQLHRDLLRGATLGGLLALIAWGIVVVVGLVEGQYPLVEGGAQGLLLWIVILTIDAAGEELLFRGYAFGRLVELVGPVIATLVMSSMFAAAHAFNPSVSWFGITNIFLGGAFFSLCYLRTRSLWVAIAAHASWNIVMAKLVGLPVSGIEFGGSVFRTPVTDPDWLTGGTFGPEGGLSATVALLFGMWSMATSRWFVPSPFAYASLFRAFLARDRANLRANAASQEISKST